MKKNQAPIDPTFQRAWIVPLVIFAGGAIALLWSVMTPEWTYDPAAGDLRLTTRVQGVWKSRHGDRWRSSQIAARDLDAGVSAGGDFADAPRKNSIVDLGPRDPQKKPPRQAKRVPRPKVEPRTEPVAPGRTATYRIKKNDRLWHVAERFLGNGAEWPKIVAHNPGLDPDRLHMGTVIEIPLPGDGVERELPPEKATRRHHVVRDNETLYTIARQYRPGSDWQWLFEANRDVIDDPDRVRSGTRLVIPVES